MNSPEKGQYDFMGRKILAALLLGILVIQTGCDQAAPTSPEVTEQSALVTPTQDQFLPFVVAAGAQATPTRPSTTSEQPASAASATMVPTTALVPFTGTPTPCGPPANWVAYSVQPGDTLFSLAQKTNTTVAEIQRANCMEGATTIIVGQVLYLPMLPSTNTPVPPTNTSLPPTSTFTPKPTVPTATHTPDRPDIVLAPGGGNDPNYIPCNIPSFTDPWIDTSDDTLEIGERRYFYACNFGSDFDHIRVTMSNNQVENAQVLASMPNPVLPPGTATAFIPWSALPTHPLGMYTMTAMDANNNPIGFPVNFWVEQPSREYILAVPPVDGPGSEFEIYFVNFNLNTTLTVERFQEVAFDGYEYTFRYFTSWDVPIINALSGGDKGWAQSTVQITSSEAALANLVHYLEQVYTIFWVR